MSHPLWYIRHMIMNEEQQAKILVNNEIKVTDHRSQLVGQTGIVEAIMADGRTLDVKLSNGKNAFLDVTLVSEIQERTQFAKTEQSLGSIANHLVQDGIISSSVFAKCAAQEPAAAKQATVGALPKELIPEVEIPWARCG